MERLLDAYPESAGGDPGAAMERLLGAYPESAGGDPLGGYGAANGRFGSGDRAPIPRAPAAIRWLCSGYWAVWSGPIPESAGGDPPGGYGAATGRFGEGLSPRAPAAIRRAAMERLLGGLERAYPRERRRRSAGRLWSGYWAVWSGYWAVWSGYWAVWSGYWAASCSTTWRKPSASYSRLM